MKQLLMNLQYLSGNFTHCTKPFSTAFFPVRLHNNPLRHHIIQVTQVYNYYGRIAIFITNIFRQTSTIYTFPNLQSLVIFMSLSIVFVFFQTEFKILTNSLFMLILKRRQCMLYLVNRKKYQGVTKDNKCLFTFSKLYFKLIFLLRNKV